MLSDLTVVIITYKRYDFLLRLLGFYLDTGWNFQVLVLDSTPYRPEGHDLLRRLDDHRVTWKRYDSDVLFFRKISDGANLVTTRYAVLAADDDFLTSQGLVASVRFLRSHADYSSCHGLYAHHRLIPHIVRRVSFTPLYEQGESSEHESPTQRLRDYLEGRTVYYPMYAVHRTAYLQAIWRVTAETTTDWGLSEIVPCALSLIKGKMKVLPILYCSREPNLTSWVDPAVFERMYSPDKVSKASAALARQLVRSEVVSAADAIEETDRVLSRYVRRQRAKLKRRVLAVGTTTTFAFCWLYRIPGLGNRIRLALQARWFRLNLFRWRNDVARITRAVTAASLTAKDLEHARADYSGQGG